MRFMESMAGEQYLKRRDKLRGGWGLKNSERQSATTMTVTAKMLG